MLEAVRLILQTMCCPEQHPPLFFCHILDTLDRRAAYDYYGSTFMRALRVIFLLSFCFCAVSFPLIPARFAAVYLHLLNIYQQFTLHLPYLSIFNLPGLDCTVPHHSSHNLAECVGLRKGWATSLWLASVQPRGPFSSTWQGAEWGWDRNDLETSEKGFSMFFYGFLVLQSTHGYPFRCRTCSVFTDVHSWHLLDHVGETELQVGGSSKKRSRPCIPGHDQTAAANQDLLRSLTSHMLQRQQCNDRIVSRYHMSRQDICQWTMPISCGSLGLASYQLRWCKRCGQCSRQLMTLALWCWLLSLPPAMRNGVRRVIEADPGSVNELGLDGTSPLCAAAMWGHVTLTRE